MKLAARVTSTYKAETGGYNIIAEQDEIARLWNRTGMCAQARVNDSLLTSGFLSLRRN
jgi:hypothetical protein